MSTNTELRPEDDFDSFMSMMGGDAPTDNPVDLEEDDIAEEEEDRFDGLNEDEDDFRKAMGGEEDEDEEEDEESDDEEEEEYDDDDDSDEEVVDVDFDTVITLPNGEQISIEDLHKGFAKSDEITRREKELDSRQSEYESKFKDIDTMLETAKLEADRVLDDFKGFDWQKLANEDPKDFANTKLFVEKYIARSKEIKEAQATRAAQLEKEEQEALQVKATACVEILKADIPEWNSDLYGEILQHAVDKLGMDAEVAKKLVDPSTIKAIHRSLQLDKGTTKAKAKLKRVSSPKKVAKSGAKKPTKAGKASPKYSTETQEFDFFRSLI